MNNTGKKDVKKAAVIIRVTPDEKAAIKELAKKKNTTVTKLLLDGVIL